MKKVSFMLIFSAFLVFSTLNMGFAANVENASAGESLDVGSPVLTFNFSPGVWGQYITAATTDDQQWFAIATVHSGGETAYATASNFASMYTKAVDDSNQPITSSNLTTALGGIPTQEASADTWSGWAKR
jgi:hypothetical protein